MSPYQLIEFIETLPESGMIYVESGHDLQLYLACEGLRVEPFGESHVIFRGRLGYSSLAMVPSVWLIDANSIYSIWHRPKGDLP